MPEYYRTREDLQKYLQLTEEEQEWFTQRNSSSFSPGCKVTSYYLKLCTEEEADNPIRRQCIPTVREYFVRPWELSDPLGEQAFMPVPRLIHRYERRALFLATDECLMYCRHCFRRNFTSRGNSSASPDDMQRAAAYLKKHPEIRELLISGGDPLCLEDGRLQEMLSAFRELRPSLVIRLCTRAPVVQPRRITSRLADMLSEFHPVFLVTQYNHPRECSPESMEHLSLCTERGIISLNQTVLLKGVNDKVETLQLLCETLTEHRIIPYYLLQGDLAEGTSHLRIPLKQAAALARELKGRISGIAMPKLAVDLPGGGGKILLLEQNPAVKEETRWGYAGCDGRIYWYPLEEESG